MEGKKSYKISYAMLRLFKIKQTNSLHLIIIKNHNIYKIIYTKLVAFLEIIEMMIVMAI